MNEQDMDCIEREKKRNMSNMTNVEHFINGLNKRLKL